MFKFKKAKRQLVDNTNAELSKQPQKIEDEYPADFSPAEIEAIKLVKDFTMTSAERLVSLFRAIDYIEQNNIEGDIVECGVWKGGSMMLTAHQLQSHGNTQRSLFLFDTYEGMSEPTADDSTYNNLSADELLKNSDKEDATSVWCYSSIDEVKQNLYSTGYDKTKLFFIKGKVEETLPDDNIRKIALLRLDTDWYESTKQELETLYDKLVPGGVLIIDDYGHWSGAKKAVDEFIQTRNLPLFLSRIDYTGRLAIKIK